MLDRINNSLNQLKQIFDIIEPYNPNDNIGYRSLKNIGVWLIAYALTEKSQQLEVVQNLLLQAKTSRSVTDVKNIIDLLSHADNLTSIINDYMKANGTFDIIISDPARLDGFKKKAKEVGLSQLIEKHLKVDPSKGADFVLDMNNTLRFSWKDSTLGVPVELIRDKNIFDNEKMNYLTANKYAHDVWYNLVKFKDDLFHVVRLGALQNNDKGPAKETSAYLIEPADQKTDPRLIQKNYFDIISLFQKNIMIKERCDELKKVATQYDQSLKFKEEIYPKGDLCFTQFNVTVHFPEIAGPLKTEEHRLGVYSGFLGKTIGSFYTGNLEYLGKRELVYDAEGGTIKNVESLEVAQSGRSPGRVVTIEYTVKGPYAMVYEAENGADYYPFKITDPRKDLEKTFESSESYDQSKEEKHETSAKTKPEVESESLNEHTSKQQKATVNPVSASAKADMPLDMKPAAKKQAESIHSMLTRSKTKPYKQTRDSLTYLLNTSEEKPTKKRQKITKDLISTSRHQALQSKAGSAKKLTFLRDYNPGKFKGNDQASSSNSMLDQLMAYVPPHNLKYDPLRKEYYFIDETSELPLEMEHDSNHSKKLKI